MKSGTADRHSPGATIRRTGRQVRDVVSSNLSAMLAVVERLTDDLRDQLTAEAPTVDFILNLGNRLSAVPEDGQILYQHARLMAAAQQLDVDLVMAMPPHEREARFRSVRLDAFFTGVQRDAELRQQGLASLIDQPDVFVFQISHRSREAKIKEGDYTWSLMPEDAQVPDAGMDCLINSRVNTLS